MPEIKVTADVALFGIKDDALHILLIQRKFPPFQGNYALPGGFIEENENLEDSAIRELKEETGIQIQSVRQIGAYGDLGRDPRGRTVTVAFYSLVDAAKTIPLAGDDAASAQFVPIDNVKGLAFDHDKMFSDALYKMRFDLFGTNIASSVLPSEFTIDQMQKAYETILGTKMEDGKFIYGILQLGILEEKGDSRYSFK